MNTLDTTLYNLRPRPSLGGGGPPHWSSTVTPAGPPTPGGSQPWNPRMWKTIDNEMSLRECSIYCYSPEEDPYDGEEGAIWSFNYFFFNKARKRVCYIYLRGLSIISHSPIESSAIVSPIKAKRNASIDLKRDDEEDSGAKKRARYWLGDRAGDVTLVEDEDESPVDEETELAKVLGKDEGPRYVASDRSMSSSVERSRSSEDRRLRSRSKSTMRGISEEIADSMEV